MAVVVTQARRRERVERALDCARTQAIVRAVLDGDRRLRCPSSDRLGERQCALPRGHSGEHLMASKLAEQWAREGRWPV